MRSGPQTPRLRIDNGGSTTITFPAIHLRPHERVRLDPIVVVVQAPAPPLVHSRWKATSTSMDGCFTGEVALSISSKPVPLVALLREPATWRKDLREER
jgi:hypothetical protein